MLKWSLLVALVGCATEATEPTDDFTATGPDDPGEPGEPTPVLRPGCTKAVHVWFEPTSGMDAIQGANGCWTYDSMVAGADGWGWCNEINGVMNVKHAPDNVERWFFDDTNPARSVALDTQQIQTCYHSMPARVPGIEVMARRADASTGALHWQKIVVLDASGWIVNHWIAELHASGDDVASYYAAWRADPGIGRPQVNARTNGASCDARVGPAVNAACRAIKNGSQISIVKNDGKLALDGGCLTHVVEALNACTTN